MKINKKYLPSETFIARVIIIIVICVLGFGIYELVLFIKNKISDNNKEGKSLIISDIIQKDSNKNGIADWEESLWGLDPTKNGSENKSIIDAKKSGLSSNNQRTSELSDNEILAREFFATIMSLQESGELNEETISNVSNLIGEQIKAEEISDTYKMEDLKIVKNSDQAKSNYSKEFSSIVSNYRKNKNIGNELVFIAEGLKNNDSQALYLSKKVGLAYKEMAEELSKIEIYEDIAHTHLSLINNCNKTGESVVNLSSMLKDPIIGMKSIINYKKYSDLFSEDLDNIFNFLK